MRQLVTLPPSRAFTTIASSTLRGSSIASLIRNVPGAGRVVARGLNGRGLHLCVRERARRTHPLSGTVAFDEAPDTVEQKARSLHSRLMDT